MNDDNTQGGAEPSPASAGSRPFPKVSPERLLEILRMNYESGDILCGDAADEIERLRGNSEVLRLRLEAAHAEAELLRAATLTKEERAAVKFFADAGVYWSTGEGVGHARKLLGLLRRLG